MNRLGIRESIVLLAFIAAVAGYLYKHNEQNRLEYTKKESTEALRFLRETEALKKVWDNREIPGKLQQIRDSLPKKNLKRFSLQGRKVHVMVTGAEGRLLNRLLGKLGALPLQIQTLVIDREGESYRLECQCKW